MIITVEEAVETIEEEIADCQKKLQALNSFKTDTDNLSETEYHILCQTNMRCSDTLDEKLVKNFPSLQFRKAYANFFLYNIANTDITVQIPSSALNCIEIRMPEYFEENESFAKRLRYRNLDTKMRYERTMSACKEILSQKSIAKKSKLVFRQ